MSILYYIYLCTGTVLSSLFFFFLSFFSVSGISKRNKNTSESLEMRRETETQTQRLGRLSVSVDIGNVGTERNSCKYVYIVVACLKRCARSLISRMHGYLC